VPSMLALFFGSLALRLLPWFPPIEQVVLWGAIFGLGALVGCALLKQAEFIDPRRPERSSSELSSVSFDT
jgi:hypothetical protein